MELLWLEGRLPQLVQEERLKSGMTTISVKGCIAGCRWSIALQEHGSRDIETALVRFRHEDCARYKMQLLIVDHKG
jgi:hypothetical protein